MGLSYKFFQQLHPYSHPNKDKIYYFILPQGIKIKAVCRANMPLLIRQPGKLWSLLAGSRVNSGLIGPAAG